MNSVEVRNCSGKTVTVYYKHKSKNKNSTSLPPGQYIRAFQCKGKVCKIGAKFSEKEKDSRLTNIDKNGIVKIIAKKNGPRVTIKDDKCPNIRECKDYVGNNCSDSLKNCMEESASNICNSQSLLKMVKCHYYIGDHCDSDKYGELALDICRAFLNNYCENILTLCTSDACKNAENYVEKKKKKKK